MLYSTSQPSFLRKKLLDGGFPRGPAVKDSMLSLPAWELLHSPGNGKKKKKISRLEEASFHEEAVSVPSWLLARHPSPVPTEGNSVNWEKSLGGKQVRGLPVPQLLSLYPRTWIGKTWVLYVDAFKLHQVQKETEVFSITFLWRKTHTIRNHLYVEMMVQMSLFTNQKQTHRHREQTCGCQGGGREVGWTGSLGLVGANYDI